MFKVTNGSGAIVFVGSEQTASHLVGSLEGYTISECPTWLRDKYVAMVKNCAINSAIARYTRNHSPEEVESFVGRLPTNTSWKMRYANAVRDGATNRSWDKVLWAVIKPIAYKMYAQAS